MFREITSGQYYSVDSAVYRLDPRTRLFGTMVFIASLFVADNIQGYVIATVVLVAVIELTRVLMRFILRGLKVTVILLLINVSFNLLLTDGCILIKFWIFKITFEGVRMASFMGLRFIYLAIGSSIMTLIITPNRLTDDLEKGLGSLKRLRVLVHEVVMMMSIAPGFIPILAGETDKITKAQMARGVDFETGNLIQKAKAMVSLLVPLFISAFRRIAGLAMIMEACYYRGDDDRIEMKPLQYRQADHDVYMIYALYFVVIIASRAHFQSEHCAAYIGKQDQ